MSRKLIVFAQKSEAIATLNILHALPVEKKYKSIWSEGKIPYLFTFSHGLIVLSNVGIHSAQIAVSTYAPQVDEVWNVGIAGALHEKSSIGKIVEVNSVEKYVPSGLLDPISQECVYATIPPFSLEGGGGRLISSDFPIHDRQHKRQLAQKWDLVDMEGYGVAYAAHHLGKKCRIWKIISDFASPGGRELIRRNKVTLSQMIAETVYEAIHESRPHS